MKTHKLEGKAIQFFIDAEVPDFIEFEKSTEGELPRFKMVAYTGRAMRVGFFSRPVVIDLTKLKIPSGALPIRAHHSSLMGVGHTTSVFVDSGKQLIAEGVISRDTEAAREVVASGKKGFPWQASVGVSIFKVDDVESDSVVQVNGRNIKGPVMVVRDSELVEISFVDRGADSRTSASVKAQRKGVPMKKKKGQTEIDPLEAQAEDPEDEVENDDKEELKVVPDKQKAVQASSTTAQPIEAKQPETDQDIQEMRKRLADERARVEGVREICAAADTPKGLEEKAIRGGWSLEKTELERLRAVRPQVPSVNAQSDAPVSHQVLEAACFVQARYPDDKLAELFDEKTLDLANKKFRSGLGLQELLLQAAWAHGYTGRSFKGEPREVLRHAFIPARELQASGGITHIDIGGILSNITNKFLLEGFMSVEQAWRVISAIRAVQDFKTVTSYRLIGKDQYEKVAPGGELKHGTLGEESFTNKAETYGLMMVIDRRDIINDDLGAISTVPRKLGRGAGLKLNDVFWTAFLNNSTFFTLARLNYFEGAATNLQLTSLTTAEQMFMDMKDADGKPIGIMPLILLVPTTLSATGASIFRSLELRDTTASTRYPVANPHAGKFPVTVARYMNNASYTGFSATAWYLLANPVDLAVIETCFLFGQESPTIETSEADFNTLGIKMRGFHDFGVALQEWRAGVKSKGAA